MNTSTKTLSAAVIALIAIFAAIALMFGQAEVTPQQEIVKLERVVIVGKRADTTQVAQRIEQLPRVVIEGRRAEAVVATAKTCAAQTLC